VAFGKAAEKPGVLKVHKTMRGGKKIISTVIGLENFKANLKDVSKLLAKALGCGISVSNDPEHGNVLLIQGDMEEDTRFGDFFLDTMPELNITPDKIVYDGKGKKGKKP